MDSKWTSEPTSKEKESLMQALEEMLQMQSPKRPCSRGMDMGSPPEELTKWVKRLELGLNLLVVMKNDEEAENAALSLIGVAFVGCLKEYDKWMKEEK